ncbi:hypothetical protein VTL71DRAFT_14547 [Oculimacula yallundae]|uniref:RRM domain-containing protein n=1 Tax=Oculimacula yallundae TaxID=86028 RepID=A0ABR4CIY3_9HELO
MATRTQANGVLSINSSQTTGNGNRPAPAAAKPPAAKLKTIVRRLAPGLTQEEFTTILGEEWKLGHGKVDWFRYKPGKDSKDASKPSKPSRAYLHLTNESHLLSLSEAVRLAVFEDATNTYNSPCLIGPPSVEFAPYGRTPAGRRRVDARAGTIDQDPEFMAFLEDLANPTTGKELNADSLLESGSSKHEKVTMTPLVQALKDKKATKNKDAAAKAAKKQEANISKGKGGKESVAEAKKGKDVKTDRLLDKATKEAVKILNREAASKSAAGPSTAVESSGSETSTAPKIDMGKVPGRQRQAVLAAHIRMLQRDLGLSPAQAHRQVRRDTADAQKAERAAAIEKGKENGESKATRPPQAQPVPTAPKSTLNQTSNRKGRGKGASTDPEAAKPSPASNPPTPKILLKKPEVQSTTASSSSTPTPTKPAAAPAPAASRRPQPSAPLEGATQAFVKHANPSQGVTEALLKEAMERFGAVTTVEIDRRKGFAYVDFADSDGLKKAMAANPISVAQGTVQVMQRKGTSLPPDKKASNQVPTAPSRGGRGGRGGTVGRRGGRGGARGGASSSEPSKVSAATPTGPSK